MSVGGSGGGGGGRGSDCETISKLVCYSVNICSSPPKAFLIPVLSTELSLLDKGGSNPALD